MQEFQTTTNFYQNLQIGNLGDSAVTKLFSNMGFHVWDIDSYRLPVDLLVWNGGISFWVQVKTRLTTRQLQIRNKERILWYEVERETKCPVFVIQVYKGKLYNIEWKSRYRHKDYIIEEIENDK